MVHQASRVLFYKSLPLDPSLQVLDTKVMAAVTAMEAVLTLPGQAQVFQIPGHSGIQGKFQAEIAVGEERSIILLMSTYSVAAA